MGISTMDDQPNDFSHAQAYLSKDHKKQLLNNVTKANVSRFVNLALLKEETQQSGGSAGRRKGKKKKAKRQLQTNEGEKDGVQEYTIEFLTMGCDLHMEHLNRACKFAIASLGANSTPQAITRIGK